MKQQTLHKHATLLSKKTGKDISHIQSILEQHEGQDASNMLNTFSSGKKNQKQSVLMRENEVREQFSHKSLDRQVFTQEEMDLIACGFKSQLQVIRKAIKNLDILLKKSKFENRKQILESYKQGLVQNLLDASARLIDILDHDCIQITGSPVPLIFFNKLKADIFRYIAEVCIGEQANEYKEKAEQTYEEARMYYKLLTELRIQHTKKDEDTKKTTDLDVIDSLRLSLNLNYAVFLYEVKQDKKSKKKALRILKKEIQDALDDFEKWEPTQIEQIKQQVELIQENINLWKE